MADDAADQLTDDAYLKQFGIEAKRQRVLGTILNGAFGIAFQGPTVGSLLIVGSCLAVAGPAFIWAFPIIIVFQVIVALLWAELASHYPLTGGIYQWAKYLGGPGLGWISGVLYTGALIVLMPAGGLVMTIVLSGIIPGFAFNDAHEIIVTILLIILAASVVTSKVRIISLINSAGVACELIVLVGCGLLLFAHVRHSPSIVFSTHGTAFGLGYMGSFMIAIAFLMALLTGFETAGIFAEETLDARVTAPRAILVTCIGVGLCTWLFAFSALLATPNIGAAMKDPAEFIPNALHAAFGTTGERIFLIAAGIAQVSTSIATMAAMARMGYGMARAGQLPFSRSLTTLWRRTLEPVVVIAAGAVLALIPLILVGQLGIIISAITGLLVGPYILVLGALLVRRIKGWPHHAAKFSLGRWGNVLSVVGLIWVVVVFVDVAWPRASTNPDWGPLPVIQEFVAVLVVLAGIWWYARLRRTPESLGLETGSVAE